VAVDDKARAVIGIGDDAIPDQDPFAWFEFDPKRHTGPWIVISDCVG
jgi:hypothetical protein